MVTRLAKVALAMRQKILQNPMKEKIQGDTGFEVLSVDDLDLVVDVCCGNKADVLLLEVANKSPGHIDEGIKIRKQLQKRCPNCKVIFLCDSKNADMGDRVVELKKAGVIDAFVYSNTSFDFLAAIIKSLVI